MSRSVLISAFLVMACSPNNPAPLVVIKVVDGDTLILRGAETQQLDLAYIDSPEREQPFGKEAKNFLEEKVRSESVHFLVTEDKKLEIMFEDKSLNLIMVEQGYAWVLPKIPEPSKALLFSDAQKTAVAHLKGLWGLGHGLMVAPWQWRQQGTEVVNNTANINRQWELEQAMKKQRQESQRKLQQSTKAQQQSLSPRKDDQ